MPRPMLSLRHTVRRAGRTLSFSRPPPGCDRPTPSSRARSPSPSSPSPSPSSSSSSRARRSRSRSLLHPSRSFPTLARFVDRTTSASPHPDPVHDHDHDHQHDTLTCPDLSPFAPHPFSQSNLSAVTAETDEVAYIGGAPGVSKTGRREMGDMSLPSHKPFLRRISSSQTLRRLSLGPPKEKDRHRMKRTSSTMSFADSSSSRIWSSTGSASLSPRSTTDDVLWMRFRSTKAQRLRRKRHSSYACSDFQVSEADSLVEIGDRLPDRSNDVAEEDVFGRRRGDFPRDLDLMLNPNNDPLLAADLHTVTNDDHTLRDINAYFKGSSPRQQSPSTLNPSSSSSSSATTTTTTPTNTLNHNHNTNDDEEATIRHITKAIDSSKGRLRKSANMSRAFRAVIKSGEGLVRKSEHLKATINSDDSKDPSMIILLDPSSCEPTPKQPLDKTSNTSEEAASLDTAASADAARHSAALGFSTSMTAKQCAATLETLLREMACKVSRYPTDPHELKPVVRLRAMRVPAGGRRMDRKIKIIVTIREEDHIRTSVSFKRLASLYSSRNSHIPLCAEIRDRFQREWPAVVEALYIRLPNSSLAPKDSMLRPDPAASTTTTAAM